MHYLESEIHKNAKHCKKYSFVGQRNVILSRGKEEEFAVGIVWQYENGRSVSPFL
jgi:hypothetical protein